MVIGANHTALEDREEVFGGVGVLEPAVGDVFLGAVIHTVVKGHFLADTRINRSFVGHKVSRAIDVGNDQAAHRLGVYIGYVEAAGVALALHQCDNSLLGGRLACGAVLGLAADIGFIGLDNAAGTTERAAGAVHGFTDAVTEEPSGLVGDADHTAHLRGAHALLGSGHDVNGQQPLVQGNVAALHDRAGADGELVAAVIAEEHPGLRLACHPRNMERTTVRAARLAVPARSLDVSLSLGSVVKDRVGDVDVHRTLYARDWLLSKVYNCRC